MGKTVNLLLYKNIRNMEEISDLLLSGKLEAAVVAPKYIYHPEQLLIAAHKCVFLQAQEMLQTKTIFTEVLYNLYPGRSIRDALKTLGVKKNEREAAFVIFDDDKRNITERISKLMDGEQLNFGSVSDMNDVDSIFDLYKIPSIVSDKDDILQVILTRMATKDVM